MKRKQHQTTVTLFQLCSFHLSIPAPPSLSFFSIFIDSNHRNIYALLFFFWTNSIDYNSAGWFISRSLLVLFEKKKKKIEKPSLLRRVCLYEESKNGKSGSYGKSWIEAYRLLYNVTNTAFMFPVFFLRLCIGFFFLFFFRGKLNFKVARVRQEEFDPQSMPSVAAHDRYLKSK